MKREDKEKQISGNFTVVTRKDENIESVIRRFLRKQKNSRIMDEIYERRHFTKPSVKIRQAKLKSIREHKRKMLEENVDD